MKLLSRAALAFFSGLMASISPAAAQVQMIIPWPAGGGTHVIGCLIQPVFTEAAGMQMIIRNVGSATGGIEGPAQP